MREHAVDDRLLDVGPDRSALRAGRSHRRALLLRRGAELGHVLDGDDDAELPLLLGGGRDDRDGRAASEEPGDLLSRADGGRQADALHRRREQRIEPFERDGEVCAALGRRDGVHLVDDDRLDPAERLPRGRGEHEVERLGGRDQDIRRRLLQHSALGRRGVSGADTDRHRGGCGADALGTETQSGLGDADQRRAEVALDVDSERLERRDVENACAVLRILRWRALHEPVDRPEERGQRLAGAGGRDHEGVRAARDGRPRTLLRGRGRRERSLEPRPGGGGEALEYIRHATILPATSDIARFAGRGHARDAVSGAAGQAKPSRTNAPTSASSAWPTPCATPS
ncbi:hypothetical protein ACH61_03108 [Rathayibacter tanaceti]|uniref:Uncharacterized protein n=1 Tax=Rathayibacter tanaceti TaxID=1671680 RepID=A0A166H232_9MICO|nr:hypothetical protein ACH61_03108 [Rathayibacter tanaceti]